jgi:hypothetical protein
MFFVSNLPSSSQAGRQSGCGESGRIGNDKRPRFRRSTLAESPRTTAASAPEGSSPVQGKLDVGCASVVREFPASVRDYG